MAKVAQEWYRSKKMRMLGIASVVILVSAFVGVLSPGSAVKVWLIAAGVWAVSQGIADIGKHAQ